MYISTLLLLPQTYQMVGVWMLKCVLLEIGGKIRNPLNVVQSLGNLHELYLNIVLEYIILIILTLG